ncbi:MAG: sigma-70 family RNA polymerase sigma factor [Planctomycetota bacterium]|nr:sigma-70 family RNA polymerase sigma factor [Planctomycetota bacterium]
MLNYEKIVKEHSGIVWNSICRLINNEADANDCFQETFLDFLKYARKKHISHPKALLAKIATRRAIDMVRKQTKNNETRQDNDEKEIEPSQSYIQDEGGINLLLETICKLPPIEAEIFCLRYLNDLTYEEIASTAGMSRSHAGVILHRSKEKLRNLLRDEIKG